MSRKARAVVQLSPRRAHLSAGSGRVVVGIARRQVARSVVRPDRKMNTTAAVSYVSGGRQSAPQPAEAGNMRRCPARCAR